MPTAVPTRKHPGKLEKDIRWEGFNRPECPDMPAGRTSTVRRRLILIAQHSIVVVLAMEYRAVVVGLDASCVDRYISRIDGGYVTAV